MLHPFIPYLSPLGLFCDLLGFLIVTYGVWRGSDLAADAADRAHKADEHMREAQEMTRHMKRFEEMMQQMGAEVPAKTLSGMQHFIDYCNRTGRTLSESHFTLHGTGIRIERRTLAIGAALIAIGFLLQLLGALAMPAPVVEYRWLGWAA